MGCHYQKSELALEMGSALKSLASSFNYSPIAVGSPATGDARRRDFGEKCEDLWGLRNERGDVILPLKLFIKYNYCYSIAIEDKCCDKTWIVSAKLLDVGCDLIEGRVQKRKATTQSRLSRGSHVRKEREVIYGPSRAHAAELFT